MVKFTAESAQFLLRPQYACCWCFGVLLLVLAIGGGLEKARYTPIYKDVTCTPGLTTLGGVEITPIKATVDLHIACLNPNPYEIIVLPAKSGTLLLGQQRQRVGGKSYGETAVLGADSTNSFVAHADIEPNFAQTFSIGSSIVGGPFLLFFTLEMTVVIEASMLTLDLPKIEMSVKQFCGIEVQLLPSADSSDAVCGESFDALVVPALAQKWVSQANGTYDDGVGFKPDVDAGTISEAKQMRDAFCNTIIAIGSLFGFLCCIAPCCAVMRQLWHARKSQAKTLDANVNAIEIGNATS